ncbi:MAG: hypothetical protein ROO73_02765 [Roseivirga sp.]
MKRSLSLFIELLLLTVVVSAWYTNQASKNAYHEQLSVHRQQFVAERQSIKPSISPHTHKKLDNIVPRHDVTAQLDDLLMRRRVASKQIKYVRGYTVQVYNGGSRDLAFKARNKLYACCPTITPEIQYDAPNYIVRAGKFLDPIEAYTAYVAIKRGLPQAIIRPLSLANKAGIFSKQAPKSMETQEDIENSQPTTDKGMP